MKSLRLGLSTLDDNVKNDARKITNKAVHTAEVYYIEGYAIKILNFPKRSWNEVFIIKIRCN